MESPYPSRFFLWSPFELAVSDSVCCRIAKKRCWGDTQFRPFIAFEAVGFSRSSALCPLIYLSVFYVISVVSSLANLAIYIYNIHIHTHIYIYIHIQTIVDLNHPQVKMFKQFKTHFSEGFWHVHILIPQMCLSLLSDQGQYGHGATDGRDATPTGVQGMVLVVTLW